MESLGTEVGQKMRCAVKAKLVELGTGSSTGYIDDELPDYVMIMVANKRSKKQMRDDLNLFLNENTDAFVSWLHQVLEKLQAVTLPPAITQKVSGKSSTTTTNPATTSSKGKEKEKEKKSKKLKRSQRDQSPAKSQPVSSSLPSSSQAPTASITDVFADQLIGKAKRSLEIESQVAVKKQENTRREVPVSAVADSSDDFNIPSVTDLVKASVVTAKRKELEELEQIQKQIDEAKRQLKIIPDAPGGTPKASGEADEDDDFLNLKADELDDEENDSAQRKHRKSSSISISPTPPPTSTSAPPPNDSNSTRTRTRSPIVFDRHHQRRQNVPEEPQLTQKSTKERLGGENIISLSAHRMLERELYTPVHRRTAGDVPGRVNRERPTSRDDRPPRRRRSESRDRRPERNHQPHRRSPVRRERSPREPRRPRERPPTQPSVAPRVIRNDPPRAALQQEPEIPRDPPQKPERLNVRQRIGSRVIVAPPKPHFDEDVIDVPVNSVVTIKPRPVLGKNRQANKNLLLRAVAEAQKSMVGIVTKQNQQQQHQQTQQYSVQTQQAMPLRVKGGPVSTEGGIKSRLGGKRQLNAIVSSLDAIVKRQKTKEKIIIEIGPNDGYSDEEDIELSGDDDEEAVGHVDGGVLTRVDVVEQEEEEYIPKPVIEVSSIRSKEAMGIVSNQIGEVGVEEIEATLAEAEDVDLNTQFVVTLDGAYKKKATRVPVRERLEAVAERRRESKQTAPVTTRSALGAAVAVAVKKNAEMTEQRGRPKQMADLRQRVEEKRKNSPAGIAPVSVVPASAPVVNSRKRRSPISFRENGGRASNGGREETREKEKEEEKRSLKNNKVEEIKQAVAPQRKRIRITDSPKRDRDEEEKMTNGSSGAGEQTVKSKVTMVTGGKEKRDPKKYDNIPPLLSSVAVPAAGSTIGKVLERCKFYPNCTKGDVCEFVHPSTPCKTFPNCKFGESCLYIHPKCKFDLACVRPDCNFSHTPVSSTAPPLSSHVVPVQNYKSISSNPLPPLCKFYPNCTNNLCTFFHPKMCFFGQGCTNKLECNFYHNDLPAADRFKWISPMSG